MLRGQVAVVTGAASGIGRALATAAARRGMHVVLADVDIDGLQNVRSELSGAGCQVLVQRVDVSRLEDLQELADLAHHEFGEVNLLFNNAGICPIGLAWDMTEQDWTRALNINVMGAVNGQTAFLPLMMSQKGPARIVNTGSIAGLFSNPGAVAYTVSKHAVVALSECLCMDLQVAGSSVSVSVVCPGFVDTNLGVSAESPSAAQEPDSVRQGREALQRTLAQGISAEDVAECTFAGIAEDRFWIFTQPETLGGFDLRCESIRNLTQPSFVQMLDAADAAP